MAYSYQKIRPLMRSKPSGIQRSSNGPTYEDASNGL